MIVVKVIIKEEKLFIEQKKYLAKELILIDGYWGSGKSLLFSLIDDQEHFFKSVIDEPIEHCLALNFLGQLSDDGLKTFIDQRKDMLIFNNAISRNVNVRINDDTGPKNIFKLLKIILRSFKGYSTKKLGREIKLKKRNIPIVVHCSINSLPKIYKLYKNNFSYIHTSRNPVDLYKYTLSYYSELYEEACLFDILISKKGLKNSKKMPWFTYDLLKEINNFENPNNIEITLLSVICYVDKLIKFKKKFNNLDNILFIDFDKLVEEPISQLKKLKKNIFKKNIKINFDLKKYSLPRQTLQQKMERSYFIKNISKLKAREEIISLFLSKVKIYEKNFFYEN